MKEKNFETKLYIFKKNTDSAVQIITEPLLFDMFNIENDLQVKQRKYALQYKRGSICLSIHFIH
jgi:hypothetical protein